MPARLVRVVEVPAIGLSHKEHHDAIAFKDPPGKADSQIMHRGAAFGDILADKLRDAQVKSPFPSGVRVEFGAAASPTILDGEPRLPFRATPYDRMAGATPRQAAYAPFVPPSLPSVAVPPAADASRPSRRTLSRRHRRALDALIGSGAALHADFTEPELRSAFRALARRYHPDRHPGSNAAESSRLARVFAALADHYRELLAVTRPPIVIS